MRPSKDRTFLEIASALAKRGTCIRKQVGCVLVDELGQILSTGYNGVARGLPHCNEKAKFDIKDECTTCSEATLSKKGLLLKTCGASACPGWYPNPKLVPEGAQREIGRWVSYYPHKCAGAEHDSGQGLDICEAIHAEQNALLQCADVQKIHTVYVTVSPCRHCMKLIMNTSTKRVVFLSEYSQSSKDLADKAGIEWILFAD